MLAARADLRRTRTTLRLSLGASAIVIALAGCTASSGKTSPGESGGSAQGGSTSAGGASGTAGNGGAGGAGGGANSGGTKGATGVGGSAGSSGGTQGSTGGAGSSGGAGASGRGGSGGSGGASTAASGGSSGGAGGSGGGSGGAAGAGGSSVECTGGQTACYGACVDLQTDPKHCGKCGNVCASDECNAGVCKRVKDCYKKTAVTDPLLADFEGYDGTTKADEWGWAFNAPPGNDKAVYAGLYEYDDGTGSPVLSISGPGNNESKYAGKIATSGQASNWGGAIGMWMGCVDASAYEGISFWVKGTAPKGTATLNLATEATSEPDSSDPAGGGTCTSGTCSPATIDFPVTTEWTKVMVTWDAFTAGTANGATVTTTGGNITGMSWSIGLNYHDAGGDAGYVGTPAAYDFEIDDIEFMGSTACEDGLRLCGTGCTDTTTDRENCGTCGNVCPTERTCTGGKCVCPSGYTDCSGLCADLNVDAQNCGGCGKACTGQCSGGTCQSSTCTANMPQQNKSSTKDASIDLGKYWINNNQWGTSGASGSQSIWSTCSSGNTIGWGTEWSWSGGSGVKTYASAVLGWQWGWKLGNTGLPVQLSANKNITSGWTYRVQPGQTMNVAYDLFAHTQSNPGTNDDPSDEIMIWLYANGGAAPIGSPKATVTIGGVSWEFWQGSNNRWMVHSYLRSGNASTGATVVISDFLKDLTANRGLSSSKHLTSIQAGTEVTSGNGRLDTDQYYCVIQ
ncbi:MAG: hypothetical protein JXP73_15810 [Deltaproteobacteria bacterium]|nr:hypothetical protein [Deltaproteobacteria bacterium]